MKARLLSLLLIALCAGLLFPVPASADGIIIPEPPICDPGPCPLPPCPGLFPCPPNPPMTQLAVRYHHVTVTIQDQVAVTHVDQVFYNPNDWPVEGTYLFPLPLDAAVSSFTLWMDGKPVEGKVLDADEARRTYEDIVRSLRDPALLEYAGRGAVQAQIFPIPPQGERRVELEYVQALPTENGLVRYVYPLNTEKFSALPLEEVTINLELRSSSAPIRAVYSPTHEVAVSRESPNQVKVGYEAKDVRPDADFALYYSLGEEQAFHLLSYRDPSDANPDGFFMLLLAPRPDASAQSLPKDVILVLDRSGSMEGEKFQQAQEALRYILTHLNPEDRFNIVTFSTGVETYAQGLQPASEASQALPWVDRLSAQGSTDINRALLEAAAMAGGERPAYLIFLTDGLPTEGVVDSPKILDNFQSAAPSNLRLFAFGVGYDVDTFLLDSLARAHHGTSSYVLPGERLDETLSAFYAKISTPVLTDLSLDFGDIAAYDLYPYPLPDLFVGSQIVVVGRYRAGGGTTVTLSGKVNGSEQVFHYPEQIFTQQSMENDPQSAIPRLWATRKIGYLLNQIRLQGPDAETIDQIVQLSVRYGIVTPYTSYLVSENAPLGAAEQGRIAQDQYNQMEAMGPAPASGQAAVEKAAGQGALSAAEVPAAPDPSAEDVVRIVGSRTFVLKDGTWVDTAFDPEKMQTVKVSFLSDDYLSLAETRPELGQAFALGPRVIAFSQGTAFEVIDADSPAPPLDLPPTPPPLLEENQPTNSPPQSTPESSATPMPASSAFPCASGLLPLILLSLAGWVLSQRRG